MAQFQLLALIYKLSSKCGAKLVYEGNNTTAWNLILSSPTQDGINKTVRPMSQIQYYPQ